MSSVLRSLRRWSVGTTPLAVFLLATVGLAVWLGYQALDAASSHRRTAESVLLDYAGISAAEYASIAEDDLDDVLDEIFEWVWRTRRGNPVQSMGQGIGFAMREQNCRCEEFRSPLALVRLDSDGTLEVIPDTLSAMTRARLARVLQGVERPGANQDESAFMTADAGEVMDRAVAIGYLVSDDETGTREPTYAFVLSTTAMSALFQEWYDDYRLLPEPIAGDQPNDSLLFVTVADARGMDLFASRISYPNALSTSAPIGDEFPGAIVTAAIRPDAASQLIIGGLPNSRLPLLVALLMVTLGVGAAAVYQLRREQVFQRLRDDFVSGVSHELRTPLAQIRMFSELQEAGKLSAVDDQRRAISVINREARRLSHLVENILQFSRMRRVPEQNVPRERLDFSDAISEGLDAAAPLVEDRGMRIDVHASADTMIFGNRDALTRIILNLLDNAAKYGAPGQTIRVETSQDDTMARLAVSDEGPGVPAAERTRIWKPYRRLDRDVKARLPGTGIGLSVVTELVDLHGGRVWVEDAPGGGALFVVELPLALRRVDGRREGSPMSPGRGRDDRASDPSTTEKEGIGAVRGPAVASDRT